jgi:hypothetical protein
VEEKPFRKNYIQYIGKYFFWVEIYFGIFFLHGKLISETYFLTKKRFLKASNKLEDLNMIYWRLSQTFQCFRNLFPKQFYKNSSSFPTWFLVNQNIQIPWIAANKLIKIVQKIKIFQKDFSLTSWRKFSWSKIVGAFEKC